MTHAQRMPATSVRALLHTVQTVVMVVFGLTMMNLPVHGAALPDAGAPSDLDVKAAFVLNFIRLVNWSGIPGDSAGQPLPVCAWAKTEFFTAVRDAAGSRTVAGRPVVFRIEPDPDPQRCRVLLLDEVQYRSARRVLARLMTAPVLTVGNGPGFLEHGGMFELTVQDGKVQFDAGLEAIRRSGLDISARLLHLARRLRGSDVRAR